MKKGKVRLHGKEGARQREPLVQRLYGGSMAGIFKEQRRPAWLDQREQEQKGGIER